MGGKCNPCEMIDDAKVMETQTWQTARWRGRSVQENGNLTRNLGIIRPSESRIVQQLKHNSKAYELWRITRQTETKVWIMAAQSLICFDISAILLPGLDCDSPIFLFSLVYKNATVQKALIIQPSDSTAGRRNVLNLFCNQKCYLQIFPFKWNVKQQQMFS